jgi:hypothetical protein
MTERGVGNVYVCKHPEYFYCLDEGSFVTCVGSRNGMDYLANLQVDEVKPYRNATLKETEEFLNLISECVK